MTAKTAFKKLLTTASAISLIAGLGASERASADPVDRTLNGDAVITKDGGAVSGIADITSWGFEADNVIFPGALVLTTGSEDNVSIGNAYLGDGVANGWITVAGHQLNINNIYGSKDSTGVIDVTIVNASSLVIGGTNLSKLGTINGDTPNRGTVIFRAKITEGQVGEIGGSNPPEIVTINGEGSAEDSVLVNKVSSTNVNVNANTTFLNEVNANKIDIAGAATISTGDELLNVTSQIYFREGSVLTVNKGGLTGGAELATDHWMEPDGKYYGTVTFNAKVNKGDVGNIGIYGGRPLGLVVISDTADDSVFGSTMVVNEVRVQGNSTFDGDATIPTLQVATGKALTTGAGVLTMSGETTLYDGATLTVGAGGIAGGGTIDGDDGSHGILKFDGIVAEDGVGAIGGDVKLSQVEINGDGASIFNKAVRADLLTIGKASDGTALNDLAEAIYLTINGSDTTFNNVTATKLTLADSKAATTNGSLELGSALLSNNSLLNIAGAGGTNGGTIDGAVDDGDGTVKFKALVDNNVGAIGDSKMLGTVEINTDGSKFNALVSANAVNIKGSTTFSDALTANKTLVLADGKTATTGGAGKVFTLNGVATIGSGSTLTIGAGGIAGGGTIDGPSDGGGTIIFNSAVAEGGVGDIGEGGSLKEVIIKNNATFNQALSADTLTLGEGSYTVVQSGLNVETVNFQSNVTIKLDSDSDSNIGELTTSEAHQGTVEFYALKTGQIGQIGTFLNPLSTIKINTSGEYSFTSEIYNDVFSVDSNEVVIHSNSSVNIGSKLFFSDDGTFVFDSTDSANVAEIDAQYNDTGNVVFNSKIVARTSDIGVGEIGRHCRVGAISVNYKGENTFSEEVDVFNLTLGEGANLTTNKNLTVSGVLTIDSGNCNVKSQLNLGISANFTADGALIIASGGSVIGEGSITTSEVGKGSVVFNQLVNEHDVGEIGNTRAIKALTVNAAGDNTFSSAISAKTITLGATGANLIASDGIKAGTAVNFASDAALTIHGDSYLSSITTATKGTGSVIFNNEVSALSDDAGVGNIGTSAKPLNELTFKANAILSGDIYVSDINLDSILDPINVEISKSVTGNILLKDITGFGHIIELKNGLLQGNIYGERVNNGNVYFYGNSTIIGDIGQEGTEVYDVRIEEEGSNVTISGNIFSQNLKNFGTLTLASDVMIFSNVSADDNSTIDLAGHNLTVTSLWLLENMNLDFGTKNLGLLHLTNSSIGDDDGQILDTSTIKADLSKFVLPSAGTRMNLIIADMADDTQAGLMNTYMEEQINLTKPNNLLVDLSPVTVSRDGDQLTAYVTTVAPSYDDLIKTSYGRINDEYVEVVWDRFLRNYANGGLGAMERQYFANAVQLTPEKNDELFVNYSSVPTIADMISSDINNHAAVIFNRNSMIAAGDESAKRGVWTNIFVGRKNQKRNQSNAGFKGDNTGITIGGDIAISENHTLGLAASLSYNNVKMKDNLKGGKVKAKNYILSLYNIYDINNWIMQGSLSVANTKATAITSDVAKFNSVFYGARGTVGYQKHFGKIMITPMAGLEYSHFGKSKATGYNNIERIISIKAFDKLSAILGGSISHKVGDFTPEVHAFANYDLTNKAQKVNVALGSDATMNLATPNTKPARLTYELGTSIGSKSNRFEYSIGYDASLTEKYVSHQGSIKLRVNF